MTTPQDVLALRSRVETLQTDKRRIEDQLKRTADGDVSIYVGGARLDELYQQVLNKPLAQVVSDLLKTDLAVTSVLLCATKRALADAEEELQGASSPWPNGRQGTVLGSAQASDPRFQEADIEITVIEVHPALQGGREFLEQSAADALAQH